MFVFSDDNFQDWWGKFQMCNALLTVVAMLSITFLWLTSFIFFLKRFLKKHSFVYLAAFGLGCIMQDLLLWFVDSLVVARGLTDCSTQAPEHADFINCGTTGLWFWHEGFSCSAACGILVHWLEIEPKSPALQGRFLTTGPPRKSHLFPLWLEVCTFLYIVFVIKINS